MKFRELPINADDLSGSLGNISQNSWDSESSKNFFGGTSQAFGEISRNSENFPKVQKLS